MQHILVCAQDSVLAKKVRFLLERDECEVEILPLSDQLLGRVQSGGISLLVLSRALGGDDAIELLGRVDPSTELPPTLVLGGQGKVTADFIHLLPDPIDTQAIYRVASELLEQQRHQPANGSEALPAPAHPEDDEEINLEGMPGLDELAGQLNQLESNQLNEQITDAFDIDETSEVMPGSARTAGPGPLIPSGKLDPARFAKVLYSAWSQKLSGALQVAGPKETLTIHFHEGFPVQHESSIPGDPLGRQLVSRSKLTESQYADGAKRAIERGLRLGHALVELGFFSEEQLGNELGTSAREQIVGCFAGQEGSFEFDPSHRPPSPERPYQLQVGHIVAEGIRSHASEQIIEEILGDTSARYFKLNRPAHELSRDYPLSALDLEFLAFEGRAYNVSDAADISGLPVSESRKLLSILSVCEEISDFTPGVGEFESRIREERQRNQELASQVPGMGSQMPAQASMPPVPAPASEPPAPFSPPPASSGAGSLPFFENSNEPTMAESQMPSQPPPFPGPSTGNQAPIPPAGPVTQAEPPKFPAPPPIGAGPISSTGQGAPPPPPAGDSDIPPMPLPANGDEGVAPRPLVYAKALPKDADGNILETPERTLSREHFQRGVTLLGKGNFSSAEEAFRDAVALCSEEHVYLIGLARAIYYNPSYRADGKVPVLKAIVGRAGQLAPEDKRVATLRSWVDHAEGNYLAVN